MVSLFSIPHVVPAALLLEAVAVRLSSSVPVTFTGGSLLWWGELRQRALVPGVVFTLLPLPVLVLLQRRCLVSMWRRWRRLKWALSCCGGSGGWRQRQDQQTRQEEQEYQRRSGNPRSSVSELMV